MQCTTGWRKWQGEWGAIDHTVAVVMLVLLRIIGYQVEGLGGWLACPPRVIKLEEGRRPKGQDCGGGFAWRVGWAWMRESWVKAAVRSEVLLGLMFLMEWWEWEWVYLLPWGVWIWKGLGVAWPGLGRGGWYRWVGRIGEEASRMALLWLALRWFCQHASSWEQGVWGAAVGGVTRLEDEGRAQVEVAEDESGVYHVRLRATFELHVEGTVEFHKRMLVIFLGLLEAPEESRGSRRTRDGRSPFLILTNRRKCGIIGLNRRLHGMDVGLHRSCATP